MTSITDPVPHPSMHRSLGIREIQDHIFEWLQSSGIGGFRYLPRLARTSTLFTEAALDILWHDLVTIVPLIKVMPDDLWTVVSSREDADDDYEIHTIQFTRLLRSSDWDRFDYYVPRINSLGLPFTSLLRHGNDDSIRIHDSVFEAFCAYRPAHPLFKSLHVLCMDLKTTYIARFVTVLLNPLIVTLSITIDEEILLAEELPGLFSFISCHCPNIQDFTVRFPEEVPPPRLASALEALTSSLSHLRKLFVLTPFSTDAIYNIGNLPDLRDWWVQLPSEVSVQGAPDIFMSTNDRFPELRALYLKASHLDHATQAMSSLQRPLTKLDIHIQESDLPSTLSTLETFSRVFPQHPCASSLIDLYLDVPVVGFEGGDVTSAFRPFLDAHNMSMFYIVSQCVLELGDTFLADVANAWPRLGCFALLPLSPSEAAGRPKATLSGLIPLMRHCPDLKSLSVNIIANPFEPELFLPKAFNMNITDLHFSCAYVDKPVAVFRCLVCMFPKLQRVSVFAGDGDWATVSSLIRESSDDIWPITRT